MFNIAIIGGESTEDYTFFKNKCIHFLSKKAKEGGGITIYSFGDEFVTKFSSDYRINLYTLYVDWKTYGKDALKERVLRMADACDGIILFEGTNKKSDSYIKTVATEKNIPIRVVKAPES